jgi:hypothetical protein
MKDNLDKIVSETYADLTLKEVGDAIPKHAGDVIEAVARSAFGREWDRRMMAITVSRPYKGKMGEVEALVLTALHVGYEIGLRLSSQHHSERSVIQ